jgi:hypothetical protein
LKRIPVNATKIKIEYVLRLKKYVTDAKAIRY